MDANTKEQLVNNTDTEFAVIDQSHTNFHSTSSQ